MSCLRSRSCRDRDSRDKVSRTASELHRQTIDHVQRRFEQKLANSERELRLAVRQRRDHSSSPNEKRQATQHLAQLRSALNNDYTQLVHEKANEIEKYMNQRYDNERQPQQRNFKEAIQEPQKTHLESIDQIIRERDAICEEKLAAQKNHYNRLLDEQAQRLRAEQMYQTNVSSIPIEHLDIAQLKGRLARVEYEHRELKQLVFNLRTDLTGLITQQPTFKSTVTIPNFVKP